MVLRRSSRGTPFGGEALVFRGYRVVRARGMTQAALRCSRCRERGSLCCALFHVKQRDGARSAIVALRLRVRPRTTRKRAFGAANFVAPIMRLGRPRASTHKSHDLAHPGTLLTRSFSSGIAQGTMDKILASFR